MSSPGSEGELPIIREQRLEKPPGGLGLVPGWTGVEGASALPEARSMYRAQYTRAQMVNAREAERVTAAMVGGTITVPTFREDPRVEQRSRADSVKRAALSEWMGSEEGCRWLADRRALLELPTGPREK